MCNVCVHVCRQRTSEVTLALSILLCTTVKLVNALPRKMQLDRCCPLCLASTTSMFAGAFIQLFLPAAPTTPTITTLASSSAPLTATATLPTPTTSLPTTAFPTATISSSTQSSTLTAPTKPTP